jgi:hypothetical protein
MKKFTLTIALTFLVSFSAIANNIDDSKLWNNKGIEQTFKKGDTVKIKAGSKSSAYVLTGKVQHVCNAKYIKVNGYFVAVADVEVITKYNTVK